MEVESKEDHVDECHVTRLAVDIERLRLSDEGVVVGEALVTEEGDMSNQESTESPLYGIACCITTDISPTFEISSPCDISAPECRQAKLNCEVSHGTSAATINKLRKVVNEGRPPIPTAPGECVYSTPSKDKTAKLESTLSTPPLSRASFDSTSSAQSSTDESCLEYTTPPQSNPRSAALNELHINDITEILHADSGVIKCFVSCNYNATPPIFTLFRESSNKFLMSAGRVSYGLTASYLISKDPQFEFDRRCKSLVGELQCDMFGLQYNLYGTGRSPWNIWSSDRPRELLASISYTPNIFFDAKDRSIGVKLMARGSYGLKDDVDRDQSAAVTLKSRDPVWNEKAQCYVLNFHGRAKLPSAKNCQLVDMQNDKDVVFQLGKYSNNMYTMDVRWPLSLLDGFALALSRLDSSED